MSSSAVERSLVSCSMSADRSADLSVPALIASVFSAVMSLQKQANLSYVLASALPSTTTWVCRSSSIVTTFSTGETSAELTAATNTARHKVTLIVHADLASWIPKQNL